MAIIDSHLHLWNPDTLSYPWLTGALRRRYAQQEIAQAKVNRQAVNAIFVQAECEPHQYIDEVRWVESVAHEVGVIGIVAGAHLHRGEETSAHLAALATYDSVVGVRHLLQSEPDTLVTTAAFLDGARQVAERGWTFDACVRHEQLAAVVQLAQQVPELPIVLDHVGKPAVGTALAPRHPDATWLRQLNDLASLPRTAVKLSGLPAEAAGDWNSRQLEPFLDAATDAFGVDRVLWGSDWPVSAVRAGHHETDTRYEADARARWADAVATWADARGYDVAAVMGGNAARFYSIQGV
ncbi:amidohydrolase family protein [Microbacterium sp. YY-01]|uniref:amidohydrolase family protein n=1 Tax=Microbacterium sp. YY-01 TaxID=3421634 RepID=UPI003D168CA7